MIKTSYISNLFLSTALMLTTACSINTGFVNVKNPSEKPQAKKIVRDKLFIAMEDKSHPVISEAWVYAMSDFKKEVYTDFYDVLHVGRDISINQIPSNLRAKEGLKAVLDSVEDHVRKNGSLKMLNISGHGDTNVMGIGNSDTQEIIQNKDLLQGLVDLQEKLVKNGIIKEHLAEETILGGCDVFNNISQHDAEIYDGFAKQLGPVTGSTTVILTNRDFENEVGGHFITFKGNGTADINAKLTDDKAYQAYRSTLNDYDGSLRQHLADSTQTLSSANWVKKFNQNNVTTPPKADGSSLATSRKSHHLFGTKSPNG